MRASWPILCILILTSGCATTSTITPYGKDTYIINAGDSSGMSSPGELQVEAAKKANQYCLEQGKAMVVKSAENQGVTWWTGTSSNLIFSCIVETDTAKANPNIKKE